MNDMSLYERVPELENPFPIKVRFSPRSAVLPVHWHEHVELLFITGGAGTVTCNGGSFSVGTGDLVIVNSNEIHSYVAHDELSHFYVLIHPQFFSDVDFHNIRLQSLVRQDAFAKSCIVEMYKEYTGKRIGGDMLIKSHAYSLMAYLMREFAIERISDREYSAYVAKLERLNPILGYISDHYNEKISTAELAEQAFLTESHFCRFFKKAIGKTPINYINELRIERAAVLLKNTNESITDVASHVGFDDVNYFSRMFKKLKNTSPGDFRTRNK